MLKFAGSVFNRGVQTFNRMAPKISRGIGEVAQIGRNIGEAAKVSRNIGTSLNALSGGRLNPYANKANEVMSKIEGVGSNLANSEGALQNALSHVSRKLNA